MSDPYVGQLTFLRVYSGIVECRDLRSTIPTKGRQERIGRLLKMHANKREEIKRPAGDIVAAVGLKGHHDRRYPLCRRHPLILEVDEFPRAGHLHRHRTQDQGRPGEAGPGPAKLSKEDPSFRRFMDRKRADHHLRDGRAPLEIIVDRLMREFGWRQTSANPGGLPETITQTARPKENSSASPAANGQYGHVVWRWSPSSPGEKFQFVDAIKGGTDPPGIHPGRGERHPGGRWERRAGRLSGGGRQGDPVDGSYHEVDSSEMAFKIAGSMGFKEGARRAHRYCWSRSWPWKWSSPEEFIGEVIGDLTSRRGKITRLETRNGVQVIEAKVPLAEMFGYATAASFEHPGPGHFYHAVFPL